MQTLNVFLTHTNLSSRDDPPKRKATIQRCHQLPNHLSSQLQLTNITTMFTDLWPRTVSPPFSSSSSSNKKSSLHSELTFNPHSWNPLVSPTIPSPSREVHQPSALANFVQSKTHLLRYSQHHRPSRRKVHMSLGANERTTKTALDLQPHPTSLLKPLQKNDESLPLLPPINNFNRNDPSPIRRRQLSFFLPSLTEQLD